MDWVRIKGYSLLDAVAGAEDDQQHRTHDWSRKQVLHICQGRSSSSLSFAPAVTVDTGSSQNGQRFMPSEVSLPFSGGQEEGRWQAAQRKNNQKAKQHFKTSSFSYLMQKAYSKFDMHRNGQQNCCGVSKSLWKNRRLPKIACLRGLWPA